MREPERSSREPDNRERGQRSGHRLEPPRKSLEHDLGQPKAARPLPLAVVGADKSGQAAGDRAHVSGVRTLIQAGHVAQAAEIKFLVSTIRQSNLECLPRVIMRENIRCARVSGADQKTSKLETRRVPWILALERACKVFTR